MNRLLDIVGSITILIVFSPVLTLITILITFFQGTPIFFSQSRLGKNQKEFKILKFRTMNNKLASNGELLPDDERITPIGQFLRRTSLDEFPGFWNVLRGDMSLVGPRPIVDEELARYGDYKAFY